MNVRWWFVIVVTLLLAPIATVSTARTTTDERSHPASDETAEFVARPLNALDMLYVDAQPRFRRRNVFAQSKALQRLVRALEPEDRARISLVVVEDAMGGSVWQPVRRGSSFRRIDTWSGDDSTRVQDESSTVRQWISYFGTRAASTDSSMTLSESLWFGTYLFKNVLDAGVTFDYGLTFPDGPGTEKEIFKGAVYGTGLLSRVHFPIVGRLRGSVGGSATWHRFGNAWSEENSGLGTVSYFLARGSFDLTYSRGRQWGAALGFTQFLTGGR